MLLKAALPSIPGVNQLPGRPQGPGRRPEPPRADPRRGRVERAHAAAYAEVCGFPAKDTVPLTYPHLLAFPLHMQAMTEPAVPLPRRRHGAPRELVTGHRPVRPGETARRGGPGLAPRPHPKGTVVDFLSEVRAGDELVWESTSTYLRRGKRRRRAPTSGLASTAPRPARPSGGCRADLGRRYAAVSGDRNPIHLYPLTAKALGFPRQIAHGMWSLARCVAALENRLPDAVTVEVAFKKPILLPGTVAFGHETDRGRPGLRADQPEGRRAAPGGAHRPSPERQPPAASQSRCSAAASMPGGGAVGGWAGAPSRCSHAQVSATVSVAGRHTSPASYADATSQSCRAAYSPVGGIQIGSSVHGGTPDASTTSGSSHTSSASEPVTRTHASSSAPIVV